MVSNNHSVPYLKRPTAVIGMMFIFLLFISSCKSKKLLDTSPTLQLTDAELIHQFRTPLAYSFFNGKAKVSISSPYGNQKGNLYLRGQKDSVLWAAVKKLSVEGGRMQIDHETATIINRLERTYQVFPLDTLSTLFGLTGDLNYLQDMTFGMTPDLDSLSSWNVKSDDATLSISSLAQNVLHQFTIDKYSGHVISGKFRAKFSGDGEWLYDDYREVKPGIYLPYYRKYDIYVSEDEYLSLEVKYSETILDEQKAIPFSIPRRYTRLP